MKHPVRFYMEHPVMKAILAALTGLALGWLAIWSPGRFEGLMTAVLAALAAAAAGTASVWISRRLSDTQNGSAMYYLTFFSISLAGGVALGQLAKDRLWLGYTDANTMVTKWEATQLGKCELARASFRQTFTLPTPLTPCQDTTKKPGGT
jgi:drug/metabolite transporter (DMT)-like permease